MKLQFKHQKFQADTAKDVVGVFAGQPYLTPTYMIDKGAIGYQQTLELEDFTGWSNQKIVPELNDNDYLKYLDLITAKSTHAGYFSIDKKGKMIDSKVSAKETTTDDVDAYDLIMKNKELLLDRDPNKSPVRFIFSHSALRERWDNPNVFQICTLKQSTSETRKRQEVGRGLRLCVNQNGERMDSNVLGNDVHNVNVLTVIASESYDSFAKGFKVSLLRLSQIDRQPLAQNLFIGKAIKDDKGNKQVVDGDMGSAIYYDLIANGYIDKKGNLVFR